MRVEPLLDRLKVSLAKRLFPSAPPSRETLGFPPFGERIRDRHRRWLKEGQNHPLKAIGGKREGQAYMQALGYQVPQTYAQLDSITDLPEFSELPPRFVIKPNGGHSVRNIFFVDHGRDVLEKTTLSRAAVIAKVGQAGRKPFLVEELLQNYDGRPGLPIDYKFNCFGDKIASIVVVERTSQLSIDLNKYWFLAPDWTLMPFRVSTLQYNEPTLPPKPDGLADMIALVRDVGARLNCFVRIDLYSTTRGVVFGEFTAFPTLGAGYTPQAEAYYGRMWQGLEGCGD